jgi:molybdopterin-guanine dinucleotide biosynthesis protein B
MIPVISFVGRSGSGKTTYLEQLIQEMKGRGYRVGVIKHDAHGFQLDQPGKDTWRHAQAGAEVVCISAPCQMAIFHQVGVELTLGQLASRLEGVDVIFTEGYKEQGWNKIELVRQEVSSVAVCPVEELLAVVTDLDFVLAIPVFKLTDITGMADFVVAGFLASPKAD